MNRARKLFSLLFFFCIMACLFSGAHFQKIYAGEISRQEASLRSSSGWTSTSGHWYYYSQNGEKQTGWLQVNDKWYYLNSAGIMQTGWTQVNGKWYYFRQSGAMQTGWLKLDNKWYYFRQSGAMQTGWLKLDNKWYYFRQSGTLQTGWLKLDNKWYYFRQSGALHTGWLKLDNKWYYFRESGAMQTGWLKLDNKWYYFRESGAMQTGWLKNEDDWYYFRESGVMQTGWLKIEDRWYCFRSDGSLIPDEEMVTVDALAPTALAPGNTLYYIYGSPQRYFADWARTQEIALEDTVLPQVADIDITTFLETAMLPVGETLYVLGGGWNASDNGAGETATYLGVYPRWKTFYDANKKGYSYENGMKSWYRGDRSWRFLGLDCTGYVGWALYNSFDAAVRRSSGYVWSSTTYADHMSWLGYGTTANINTNYLKAGDIVSMKETHVYIVLGRCSDGSILLLQSVPSGGVVVTGTGYGTVATRLAGAFMQNHYPDWWYYFSKYGLYSGQVPKYTTGKYFTWTNRFSDSAGLRDMTGEQVLAYLESQM